MDNILKLGLLLQQAAKNAASQETCALFVDAYQRVDDQATQELRSLRLSMVDMTAERAAEMAILLAKAGA